MVLSAMAISSTASAEAPHPEERFAIAIGAALQGEGARARLEMLAIPRGSLGDNERKIADCLIQRMAPASRPERRPGQSHFAFDVLHAFQTYWHATLSGSHDPNTAEEELRKVLLQLLSRSDNVSLDALAPDLEAALRAEGWWSLQGRTGRLRELMLWRVQEERVFDVILPERQFSTRVMLLDDFASLGWGDFATCGKRGAGGWATDERLYAVVPRYASLDGEEFRVTFLGHETQHFADLQDHPELEPWMKEYRAKLVEIAMLNDTRDRVLAKFIEDRGGDRSSPHSFANLRIIDELVRRFNLKAASGLFDVPIHHLNRAGREMLLESTKTLVRTRISD